MTLGAWSCGLRARTCGAGAPASNLLSLDLACRDGRDALCPWPGHAAIPPLRLLRDRECSGDRECGLKAT